MHITDKFVPDFVRNPNPEIYYDENYLVLDFETTSNDFGSALEPTNDLVCCNFRNPASLGSTGSVTVVGGEYDCGEVVEQVRRARFIVAHNAKFELQWLKRLGCDLREIIVWDTQVAEYVINGNIKKPLDLDTLGQNHFGVKKDPIIDGMMNGGVCPSRMPLHMLVKRCELDVATTEALFLYQREKAEELGLLNIIYSRCLLTPVLADIEEYGMMLDADRVGKVYAEHLNRYESFTRELQAFSGAINWNSPDQVSGFLYDDLGFSELRSWRGDPIRSSTGKRLSDKKTLAKLTASNQRQRRFLELYEEWNKIDAALSKSLQFFLGVCEERGGIFRAVFNQTVTATHRLSSSGKPLKFRRWPKPKSVQFQNMPRAFKKLIKARHKGWLIGESDGASLEFRVAAQLAYDDVACASIRNEEDVHSFTASIIGVSRQDAKPHTFKPLYGGRSGTPKEVEYYEAFREKYPQITQMQEDWVQESLRTKQLRTITGFRFYWPFIKMSKTGYVNDTCSICNYPVQQFATADIIPVALVCQWHRMKGMQSFIVNTVHDSTVSEVHPDEVDQWKEIVTLAFTHDVYEYMWKMYSINFVVPLGIGMKLGPHWGEGDEIKSNVEPPRYA